MFEVDIFSSPVIDQVISEASRQEANFEAYMNECGHERKTTFFSDFAIADMAFMYGEDPIKAVKDTYRRASAEWIGNVEYFTELVMVLNLRGWNWYNKGNEEMSKLYFDLYYEADGKAIDTFKGEDLEYYYDTTD